MSKDVAGDPFEDSLYLDAVDEDIVDVGVHALDVTTLAIAETVSKVIVPKDKHVVMREDLAEVWVPLQVLCKTVADKHQCLKKDFFKEIKLP